MLTPMLAASIGWEPAMQVAAALAVVAALLWFGIDVDTREPEALSPEP